MLDGVFLLETKCLQLFQWYGLQLLFGYPLSEHGGDARDDQKPASMNGNLLPSVPSAQLTSSVRPSTPFSADTDTPIFCCQSNTIPIF